MTITQAFKRHIKTAFDIDMVGIASAQALMAEPEGHRPTDLLPGAKCIIVFGHRLTDGAVTAGFRALEEGLMSAQSSYAAYASDLAPNFLLLNTTNDISTYIEDTYHAVAMPMPFSVQQNMVWDNVPGPLFADPYGQGMPLNIYQAAMAAGLGEFGWSNRFLTPDYGPRQILSAVVTTLDFECDPPYNGPTLCDPTACGICHRVCPTCAIPRDKGKTLAVEGKEVEVADIKVNTCIVASMAMRKEFGGRMPVPDLIMDNDPTDEALAAAFEKKPVNGLSVDHFPRYFCDRCLLYCPVGGWDKRFGDTGFSHFNVSKEPVHPCTTA